MKVFPDGKLYIISGCPCDPDYEHTLYWPNKEGQHAYFLTKAKYRVDNMSYQRAKRGRVRVQYKVEDLYDCNYIAFQNSSFGNKWFYAFIDDVTYVNNITSEISYTIDVIQTWITEMELQQCFVEREHSETDAIGDNIIPENIDPGTMILESTNWQRIIPFTGYKIVVAQASHPDGEPVDGGFYGSIYNQVEYRVFNSSETAAVKELIRSLNVLGNKSAITSVFMCPDTLEITKSEAPNHFIDKEYKLSGRHRLTRSDGSATKNGKTSTYPYTYMEITNSLGNTNSYAYEFFTNPNEPVVTVTPCFSDKLSLYLSPNGYKMSNKSALKFDEGLSYDAFPECMWANDLLAARLVNAGMSAAMGALTGAMTGGWVGAAVGGGAGLIQGMMSGGGANVSNIPFEDMQPLGAREDIGKRASRADEIVTRANNIEAQTAAAIVGTPVNPLSPNITPSTGYALFNSTGWGFFYAQVKPTPQMIDRIDDYFSRYGYKTNKIKIPNYSSRPHWNYVQTIGCKVGGSIPALDEKEICSIFNRGVTFWKHPEEVGNYSLDNSPT